MPFESPSLLDAIRVATSFDEAGLLLLRRLLNMVAAELARSRFAQQGEVVRGLIHLRSEEAYRQVLVVSRAPGSGDWAIERNPATVASAKKWREVAERQSPVSSDASDAAPSAAEARPDRLGIGNATHVFSLPLRALSGTLDGMVCLEAQCPTALGENFIWDACTQRLQRCCDVAAPYLLQLPGRPVPESMSNKFLPVLGSSMAKVAEILRVFAQQEETLLISGPTGSGKSRLARWCHEMSSRKGGRFEAIDLSNVPETLQLAEMTGWKKGAFTDAVQDTPGAIARAEGGTLFIDEIDKLSFKAQAGLLHILEERKYRPLGERGIERDANVRFLIGTNTDLQAAVRAQRFREDLYYRIHVLPVKVPPLCERRDEIVPWARYMLQRRHNKTPSASIRPDAEALLQEQPWPGNLRQLDNIICRAYALCMLEGVKSGEMMLGLQHIERALQWEHWPLRARPLSDLLTEAAESFVRVAQQRPLDLDLADAFRGLVLASAIRLTGDRESSFRLLGKEQLVKNRNHQKVLKRELERVAMLFEAIGEKSNVSVPKFDAEAFSDVEDDR